jgi:hypothetical protein
VQFICSYVMLPLYAKFRDFRIQIELENMLKKDEMAQ